MDKKSSSLCMLYSYHRGVEVPKGMARNGLFRPVYLPQNKYYEGWTMAGDWSNLKADWVGHITYSYKTKIPAFDFEKVVEWYSETVDVIGLFKCSSTVNMYVKTEKHHKGFMRIWTRLIHLLGYGDVRKYPEPIEFYRNYWIMRKELFLKYSEVVKRAMELMEEDDVLREWANEDSSYVGNNSTEVLLEVSGYPYYTFHSFIIERLVCFFATVEGARTVVLPLNCNWFELKQYD
jgi:hypothetical protein